MAGENTISTLEGLYKEVYANEGPDDVLPTSSVLYDLVSFDSDLLGDSYHVPVVLTFEHGATYNGSGGGVVTLNDPVNAVLKDASTSGYEMILRSRLSYAAASRAAAGGKQAFKRAWGQVLLNLRKAAMKRLELSLLYGQRGLGIVSGAPAANVITITAESWSPTTWAGMEGAVLEAFDGVTGSDSEHNSSTDLTIEAIDYVNRTITVTNDGNVADGDYLFLNGARTASAWNEMPGLCKIAGNDGTLFGINSDDYSLWAGNASSSFGAMTMGKALNAITSAVDKGLDEGVVLLVNPKAWEVLNSDLAAQRMFDGSYSRQQAESGVQSIKFFGQMGEVDVRTHPFLRRGDAVIFPKSALKRVGSADVGMGIPGTDGRDVFFHLTDKNAVEARTFTDQAVFCDAPSHCVYISGITYT